MSLLATNREYKSSWWSINMPPNWFVEEDDTCVAFTKVNGVGAMQISAAKHDSGSVSETDLRDFIAGTFPEPVAPRQVACGRFSGVGVDYVADGTFWLKRWVHNGGLLLFVTYNCDFANRALESTEIAQMLSSLKPLDAT